MVIITPFDEDLPLVKQKIINRVLPEITEKVDKEHKRFLLTYGMVITVATGVGGLFATSTLYYSRELYEQFTQSSLGYFLLALGAIGAYNGVKNYILALRYCINRIRKRHEYVKNEAQERVESIATRAVDQVFENMYIRDLRNRIGVSRN